MRVRRLFWMGGMFTAVSCCLSAHNCSLFLSMVCSLIAFIILHLHIGLPAPCEPAPSAPVKFTWTLFTLAHALMTL